MAKSKGFASLISKPYKAPKASSSGPALGSISTKGLSKANANSPGAKKLEGAALSKLSSSAPQAKGWSGASQSQGGKSGKTVGMKMPKGQVMKVGKA